MFSSWGGIAAVAESIKDTQRVALIPYAEPFVPLSWAGATLVVGTS